MVDLAIYYRRGNDVIKELDPVVTTNVNSNNRRALSRTQRAARLYAEKYFCDACLVVSVRMRGKIMEETKSFVKAADNLAIASCRYLFCL